MFLNKFQNMEIVEEKQSKTHLKTKKMIYFTKNLKNSKCRDKQFVTQF